jgi:hypothetical protein
MKKAIFLGLMLVFVLTGCGAKAPAASKILTPEEAKARLADFINNELLIDSQHKATVDSVAEDNGLYKLSINVYNLTAGAYQKLDTYMTRDASLFFPQVISMIKKAETAVQTQETPAPAKTAKPSVELFVMSHCPYGTEIEKGILPVVAALGKKIDFAVKFCDYSMHGEKELKEEMNQSCIEQNEPAKFASYLDCFLADGKAAADFETTLQKNGQAQSKSADILAKWAKVSTDCMAKVKINQAKVKTCAAAMDKQYKVMSGFADQSTWAKDKDGNPAYPAFNVFKTDNAKYGVGGSPTIVINGRAIDSARDSASLLKTICSGFDTQPAECQTALSSESPSAGFGYGTGASAGSDASCQ